MKEPVYEITEEQIVRLVQSVLSERKVIKVPNSQPAPPPAPPMGGGPDMGGAPPMGGPQDMGPGPMGPSGEPDPAGEPMGPPDMGGQDNQFDHNFDAGVEADEDSDPKTYIQQLTGKLSQSLNSFNTEQGSDPGLNKYVAAMIIQATCKNLEQADKDELIEKIKKAQTTDETPTEETPEMGNGTGEGMEGDMGGTGEPPAVNERVYSKKQLKEMMTDTVSSERDDIGSKEINTKSPFSGKIFDRKR